MGAVQKHHEKARLPQNLIDTIRVKPHILKSNGASAAVQQSTTPLGHSDLVPQVASNVVTKEEADNSSKYAALSSYLGSPDHSSDPGSPPPMLNSSRGFKVEANESSY